jgi:hypothetical protein
LEVIALEDIVQESDGETEDDPLPRETTKTRPYFPPPTVAIHMCATANHALRIR